MIVIDNSGIAMAGQQAAAIAALKEFVAYVDQRWPAAQPRQLWVDTAGELGRIHHLSMWESLMAHELSATDWAADTHRQALVEKIGRLLLPDSGRRTFLRVV